MASYPGEGSSKRPLDETPAVNIKVKGQDQREVFFKVKRKVALAKVLTAYCEKVHVEYRTMHFYYNGERVLPKRTPEQLGMEDGDEIDATTDCGGGCRGMDSMQESL